MTRSTDGTASHAGFPTKIGAGTSQHPEDPHLQARVRPTDLQGLRGSSPADRHPALNPMSHNLAVHREAAYSKNNLSVPERRAKVARLSVIQGIRGRPCDACLDRTLHGDLPQRSDLPSTFCAPIVGSGESLPRPEFAEAQLRESPAGVGQTRGEFGPYAPEFGEFRGTLAQHWPALSGPKDDSGSSFRASLCAPAIAPTWPNPPRYNSKTLANTHLASNLHITCLVTAMVGNSSDVQDMTFELPPQDTTKIHPNDI